MKNTICNTLLSVVETKDAKFIENKVKTIESELSLNEVEHSIIKDIKDNLYMSNLISKEFISEKYPYYVENDENVFPVILSKEAIDSAIIDIRLRQLKSSLAKDMLNFGSKIADLSPSDIKAKFNDFYSNILLENRNVSPKNAVMKKETPYEDLIKNAGGLSLVIPKIEEHAGKATKGSIVSILAFTGEFKSTYAVNVAYQNAMAGENVLYLSLEGPTESLVSRLVLYHIAQTVKSKDRLIDARVLRDGQLTEVQAKFYNDKHNELIDALDGHLILWGENDINYKNFTEMTETLRLAEKKFQEKTGKGLDAVVVDQLALLKYEEAGGKKYTYDGAIMNDWVSYFRQQSLNFLDEAKEIVVFMVSQTSRNAYAEASKEKNRGRYTSSSASDSHELERASTTMITLWKGKDNSDDTVLINIPKARNGYSPRDPIQTQAYGQYFHVGPLKFNDNEAITSEQFDGKNITIEDLFKF